MLSPALQRKLRISEPGDVYEEEADRVAEQVMRMTAPAVRPQPLQPGLKVQRYVIRQSRPAGDELSLQRAEAADEQPVSDDGAPKDSGPPQGGSRCPSWRGDPQSISKRAGEFYARNHLTPLSQATVERIECEPPIANGNYGCYVHFSDGLVLRVIVRETDVIVGTGPGPITTEHPPPATPLCFYEYACPEGDLVLTVKKCQSAKPPASSGPPAVAQRSAAWGTPGPAMAPSIVHHVLAVPGQPLDRATRGFFEPRFGFDFSHVRVHADVAASESAGAVNALAYTVGSDIVFRTGQFDPQSNVGRRLLAHELTHVVQGDACSGRKRAIQRKADISPLNNESVKQGNAKEEPQPMPPVDCAVEITPVHDCFALIADMIAIQADMRENNQWLERYRNEDIPWDVDAYTARARYQGDLRAKFEAKERVREACCPGNEVPGEAPTMPPTAAPAPGPQPVQPDQNGLGR